MQSYRISIQFLQIYRCFSLNILGHFFKLLQTSSNFFKIYSVFITSKIFKLELIDVKQKDDHRFFLFLKISCTKILCATIQRIFSVKNFHISLVVGKTAGRSLLYRLSLRIALCTFANLCRILAFSRFLLKNDTL